MIDRNASARLFAALDRAGTGIADIAPIRWFAAPSPWSTVRAQP